MTDRVDGGSGDALATALSLLRAGMTAVADLKLWQQPDTGLCDLAATLDELARQQEGQLLRLLGEVATRGLPGQDGTGSTGAWLRSVVPTLPPQEAGSLGKRAERLYRSALSPELGPVREAVEAGELRRYQERLVVETVAQLTPPNTPVDGPDAVASEVVTRVQKFLIQHAAVLTSKEFTQLVTALRHHLDPHADDRLAKSEAAQQRARTFTMATEASGMVFVQGSLTPECGAALRHRCLVGAATG